MNRLLQGDVGSGKTVVAIAAMLLADEVRIASGVDGADTDSGGATLRSFAQLARSARNSNRASHRRTPGRQRAVAVVCARGREIPGCARVSRVGDGVTPSADFSANGRRARRALFTSKIAAFRETLGDIRSYDRHPEAALLVTEGSQHRARRIAVFPY